MRFALVLATLALAACGGSEDRFWDKYENTYCESFDACHTGDTPCPFSLHNAQPDPLYCTFDAKKARECLKGDFVCNDAFGPGNEWVDAPAVCDEVYTCTNPDTDAPDDTGA